MYNLKRTITGIIAGVITLSALECSVFAADYMTREEAAGILAESADLYVDGITEKEILSADMGEDKDSYVGRMDFLNMTVKAFDNMPQMNKAQKITAPEKAAYKDVPAYGKAAVDILNSRGILYSKDNMLKPDENISKEEATNIIRRIWSLYGNSAVDDFYSYALNKRQVKAKDGYILEAAANSEVRLANMLSDICIGRKANTPEEKKILAYFDALTDFEGRDKRGVEPIKPYIDAISNAKDHKQLEDAIVKTEKELCVSTLFTVSERVTSENNTKKACSFGVYPATFTYDELKGNYADMKKEFTDYATTLFKASGQSQSEARKNGELLFACEEDLAKHSLSIEQLWDPRYMDKTYSSKEIAEKVAVFDTDRIIETISGSVDNRLYVDDDMLFGYFTEVYCDGKHLEELKMMALASLMASTSQVLDTDTWLAGIRFGNYIEGSEYLNDMDDINLVIFDSFESIKGIFGDYLENIYCDRYYDESVGEDVRNMTKEIISAYESNIRGCTWLGDKTKERAVKKLENISINIGYDKNVDPLLDSIEIKGREQDGALQNLVNIMKKYSEYAKSQRNKPADVHQWPVSAYYGSACYIPDSNSIYIPAAAIMVPAYNKADSREENLAKIGCTIAHEISHAFDGTGSLYDEKGNMVNWWQDEDREAFDRLIERIEEYYDGYESYNGVITNGSYTADENFADICALGCVLSILEKEENVDYNKFFETYALALASVTSDRGYVEYGSIIDPHATGRARGNLPLTCYKKFYDTYNVREGDGMYVPEGERISIW